VPVGLGVTTMRMIRLALAGVASAMAGNALAGDQSPLVAAGDLIIGTLARPSDGGRWMLRQINGRLMIDCNGHDCPRDLIDVEVRAGAGSECNDAMLEERVRLGHPSAFERELVTIDRPGFEIRAVLIDNGVS
jgi:hypothetical protein